MLVCCYAPTLNSSEQEKDDFYDLLREVISNVQHRDKLVLMGDFNARVGSDNHSWKGVLGPHGVGRMNSNGLRLLIICRDFDLSITNTFYQQPNCRKTTWIHPRSKDWHLLDYVITKRRDIKDFRITRPFHTTCYLSDHALLRSKATYHLEHRWVKKSTVPKQMNTISLKSAEKQTDLETKI